MTVVKQAPHVEMSDTGNDSATLICKLLSYETSSGLVYHDIQPSSSTLCNPWAADEPGLHCRGLQPTGPLLELLEEQKEVIFCGLLCCQTRVWFAEALRAYSISHADHSKALHDTSAVWAWVAVSHRRQSHGTILVTTSMSHHLRPFHIKSLPSNKLPGENQVGNRLRKAARKHVGMTPQNRTWIMCRKYGPRTVLNCEDKQEMLMSCSLTKNHTEHIHHEDDKLRLPW